MKKPEIDVRYVANLARLRLTDEQAARFQEQLSDVLAYMDQLLEVDVSGVEPMAHTFPLYNVMAEDEPRSGFSAEEALANAPHSANELFIVTKVVE